MYGIVIGFLVTFILALIFSAICHESDCDDPDLFTPFVAKRMRKRKSHLRNDLDRMVKILITYFT